MKHLMIPLLLAGGFVALSTMEASAVVCARGVVRAGCVAAGGAAVVVGGLLSVGRSLWLHGGSLFVAGCTDHPATHQLKTCRAINARQSICGLGLVESAQMF